MVLATAEATLNTAVDALIDAWVVYVNLLGANEEIKITFVSPSSGDTAADSTQGTAAVIKAAFRLNRVYHWDNNPNTADNVPLSVAGKPLFWKVTNTAGDLAG